MAQAEEAGEKLICKNRRAFYRYDIQERLEGGLVLVGSEVKSLRGGGADLVDSYAALKERELWLVGAHFAPYPNAAFHHDPRRPRKILLHKEQVRRIAGKLQERGFTLVPLRLYFKKGRVKVELGLGKGKKTHDRRQELREREAERAVRDARRSARRRGP